MCSCSNQPNSKSAVPSRASAVFFRAVTGRVEWHGSPRNLRRAEEEGEILGAEEEAFKKARASVRLLPRESRQFGALTWMYPQSRPVEREDVHDGAIALVGGLQMLQVRKGKLQLFAAALKEGGYRCGPSCLGVFNQVHVSSSTALFKMWN